MQRLACLKKNKL